MFSQPFQGRSVSQPQGPKPLESGAPLRQGLTDFPSQMVTRLFASWNQTGLARHRSQVGENLVIGAKFRTHTTQMRCEIKRWNMVKPIKPPIHPNPTNVGDLLHGKFEGNRWILPTSVGAGARSCAWSKWSSQKNVMKPASIYIYTYIYIYIYMIIYAYEMEKETSEFSDFPSPVKVTSKKLVGWCWLRTCSQVLLSNYRAPEWEYSFGP